MENKPRYVIQMVEHGDTHYVELSVDGFVNWTSDLVEASTWTSKKRAEAFAEKWVRYTSGWNGQTDTNGPSRKHPGVTVVEKG